MTDDNPVMRTFSSAEPEPTGHGKRMTARSVYSRAVALSQEAVDKCWAQRWVCIDTPLSFEAITTAADEYARDARRAALEEAAGIADKYQRVPSLTDNDAEFNDACVFIAAAIRRRMEEQQ